jgi:hypothetical protein
VRWRSYTSLRFENTSYALPFVLVVSILRLPLEKLSYNLSIAFPISGFYDALHGFCPAICLITYHLFILYCYHLSLF